MASGGQSQPAFKVTFPLNSGPPFKGTVPLNWSLTEHATGGDYDDERASSCIARMTPQLPPHRT